MITNTIANTDLLNKFAVRKEKSGFEEVLCDLGLSDNTRPKIINLHDGGIDYTGVQENVVIDYDLDKGDENQRTITYCQSCEDEISMTDAVHYLINEIEINDTSELTIDFNYLKFLKLSNKWKSETEHLSSTKDIAMNSAYQEIIGMGKYAVPFILNEMENEGGHWFWALQSITGEDPISLRQRGRIDEMTEEWLRWGKENRGFYEK